MDEAVAVVRLAIIFHDPPWKPWTVTGRFKDGLNTILNVLEGFRDDSNVLIRVLGEFGITPRDLDKFLNIIYNNINVIRQRIEGSGDKIKKHEKQAVIVPLLVHKILENREDMACKHASKVFEATAEVLLGGGGHHQVTMADRLAAGIDRALLKIAEEFKGDTIRSGDLIYVNPFDPRLRQRLANQLDPMIPAIYAVAYSYILSRVIMQQCDLHPAIHQYGNFHKLVVHLAYQLVEPVWYMTVKAIGYDPLLYVPPADTRVPHHTVFDHLHASLVAANLLDRGCLAQVSLAGVQSWISESRRLRDLWASSWMASLLAWKAVEEIVLEEGPGALLMPFPRPHPFLAARLLHLAGCGKLGSRDELCGFLARLLGLRFGAAEEARWPIDPMTGVDYLLALPAGSCKVLRERVVEGVEKTWRRLLISALGLLEKELVPVNDELIRALEKAKEIEPPLSIRIVSVNYKDAREEAYREAADIIKRAGVQKYEDIVVDSIVFDVMRCMLRRKIKNLPISAPGRRTGLGYLEYARTVKPVLVGAIRKVFGDKYRQVGQELYCQVCGRGIALYHPDLWEPRQGVRTTSTVQIEAQGERLCPYCLVKRLTMRMIRDKSSFAGELVGVPPDEQSRRRLSTRLHNIDVYTTRAQKLKAEARNVLAKVEAILINLNQTILEKTLLDLKANAILAGITLGSVGWTEYNHAGKDEYLIQVLEAVESIILEASHEKRAYDQLCKDNGSSWKQESEPVKSIMEEICRIVEKVWRPGSPPRRYAILRTDGDLIGEGLHYGSLYNGVRGSEISMPKGYASHLYNISMEDEIYISDLIEIFSNITSGIDPCVKGSRIDCNGKMSKGQRRRSLVPGISYVSSLSRALAGQAYQDRRIIEEAGGALIYTGGDDLLAILTPFTASGEGWNQWPKHAPRQSPAMWAVLRLRLSYWGVDDYNGGRSTVRFLGDVGLAVPPIQIHGRSAALGLYTMKLPLWIAIEESYDILNSKDDSMVLDVNDTLLHEKDLFIVYSDSRSPAVLPFMSDQLNKWSLERDPVVLATRIALAVITKALPSAAIAEALQQYARYAPYIGMLSASKTSLRFAVDTLEGALLTRIISRHVHEHVDMDIMKLWDNVSRLDTYTMVRVGTKLATLIETHRRPLRTNHLVLPTSFEVEVASHTLLSAW